MRIELAQLEGAKGEFGHEYQPGELVLDDERLRIVEGPTVAGRVRRDGTKVKLAAKVEGKVEVECDRCLKPITLPVSSNVKLDYMTTADYKSQHAVELGEEDLNVTVFDGETIDIDALVAEELQLAIPDQTLCTVDCKGICSVCGANKNATDCNCETKEVDPRWAGLKDLVNRK